MSEEAEIRDLPQGRGRDLPPDDRVDRLVVEGRMKRGSGGLLAIQPLRRVVSKAGTEALARDRAE